MSLQDFGQIAINSWNKIYANQQITSLHVVYVSIYSFKRSSIKLDGNTLCCKNLKARVAKVITITNRVEEGEILQFPANFGITKKNIRLKIWYAGSSIML